MSAAPPGLASPVDWPALLRSATGPAGIGAAYQPIVDVARGTVVGYEALARFPGYPVQNPEEWFAAAREVGVSDRLEAAALRAAFAPGPSLPANCFLTVNVSPGELARPAVREVLDAQGDLGGVVIELTEQTPIESYVHLEPYLDRYRAAGALIAVDDAGSGYAGLRHLLSLQPAIIKLDRHFVDGIDRDQAKRVLVEMLGTFTDRTDGWLLAEGIERAEELEVVAALGVPLAQGYLLGRPAPPWSGVDTAAGEALRSRARTATTGTVRDLVEAWPSADGVDEAAALLFSDPHLDVVVVLDGHGRPAQLADTESVALGMTSEALRVNLDTPVAQAGRRSLGRPARSRFQPLVCTDNAGRYAGIVRMERVVEALAGPA